MIAFDPESPRFNEYKGLKYFPVNPEYRFVVPLKKNLRVDTVLILSSRGNMRKGLRVGWFEFSAGGKALRLAVTRLLEPGVGEKDHSIFFRDRTCGEESYAMGRYVEAEELPDGRFSLDFNKAYNPACAFSPHYNCPVPPEENHLPVRIPAGEMDAHYVTTERVVPMIGKTIQPEIEALIGQRDFTTLRAALEDLPSPDVAEVIEDLPRGDRAVVFRMLQKQRATETFEYLDLEAQRSLLDELAGDQVNAILNDMRPDDRTALLEELPAPVARDLIQRLSPEERRVAQALLGYPEESIGRLMTLDYVAVDQERTIQEVLDTIRTHGKDSETLNVIYVVDQKGHLVDDLRIRELLLAPLDAKIRGISDGTFVALSATDDQETAVRMFNRYSRVALPVTDSEGILLGHHHGRRRPGRRCPGSDRGHPDARRSGGSG